MTLTDGKIVFLSPTRRPDDGTCAVDLLAQGFTPISWPPERRAHVERAVHFERQQRPVAHRGVGIPHLESEEVDQHGREDLHLPVRELLPQADARPRL